MSQDLLTAMQENMQRFSKGQRRIAQFMLEHRDEAAFLTAGKLGKKVGVSESTVVRFAVDLGFDGYPGMQKAMQELALGRLSAGPVLAVQEEKTDRQDFLLNVIQSDMQMLRKAGDDVDRTAFQASADALSNARRIYVIGVQRAAPVAYFLGNDLKLLIPDVHILTDSGIAELFEQIVDVNQNDVVVAISFSQQSRSVVQAVAYCRNNGATVISMTDQQESALAKIADHLIYAGDCQESPVVPMSVANALCMAISSRRERELQRKREKLAQIYEQFRVYEEWDVKI